MAQAINQLSHPDIAPLLIKEISSESPPELLTALGKIGGEQAVETLKDIITQTYQRIEDKEAAVLEENQYALVVAAGINALALSLSPLAVTALSDMARQDFFADDFREEAVRALGKMRLALSDRVLTEIVLDATLPAWLRTTAAENLPTPLPAGIEQALLTAFTLGAKRLTCWRLSWPWLYVTQAVNWDGQCYGNFSITQIQAYKIWPRRVLACSVIRWRFPCC
ncbi:MAG: hypothetical protein HS126_24715 [Anaerolineales bacterium]|nr:hypothetical protein [Anaerolineales bacterium]